MATAQFNSPSGGVNYLDGTNLNLSVGGHWVTDYRYETPKYDIEADYLPGVDGSSTKNYKYREQFVAMKLAYISDSENNCSGEFYADAYTIGSAVSNLALAGINFPGCILMEAKMIGNPKSLGPGPDQTQYRADAIIVVKSTR